MPSSWGKEQPMQFATLIVAIVNLIVLSIMAVLAVLQIRKTQEWNRRRATLDLLTEWDVGRMRELRDRLEAKVDIYNPQSDYESKKGDLDKEDDMALDGILNALDNVGLAVRHKVLNERMAYECLSGIVAAYWRWARPYINQNKQIDIRLWDELDPLVARWADWDRAALDARLPKGSPKL